MLGFDGVVLKGSESECRDLEVSCRKETTVRNVSSGAQRPWKPF